MRFSHLHCKSKERPLTIDTIDHGINSMLDILFAVLFSVLCMFVLVLAPS